MIVLLSLASVLFLLTVVIPIYQHQRKERRRQLLLAYRDFQIDVLRARYPILRFQTDREIRQEYQVDRIFHRLRGPRRLDF